MMDYYRYRNIQADTDMRDSISGKDKPEEDKQTSPHTKGSSAVQFILTSSIVIHTLDLLEAVYINIFSCKKYDTELAERITKEWFGASESKTHFIERI